MTEDAAPEDGGTDWRRLARERNVPLGIARALWERAWAAASGDPVQAEHAFLLLLEDAEAANITQEPGRGTLADSSGTGREVFSPGPGKWTRVLVEQPKAARAAPRAQSGKRPTADQLRNEILAAEKAAKDAAALLASSDPATIIQALHEVSRGESFPVLQKVVGMAGDLVGRILSARAKASPATSSSTEGASTEGASTEGASTEGAGTEGASTEGAGVEGGGVEGTEPASPESQAPAPKALAGVSAVPVDREH